MVTARELAASRSGNGAAQGAPPVGSSKKTDVPEAVNAEHGQRPDVVEVNLSLSESRSESSNRSESSSSDADSNADRERRRRRERSMTFPHPRRKKGMEALDRIEPLESSGRLQGGELSDNMSVLLRSTLQQLEKVLWKARQTPERKHELEFAYVVSCVATLVPTFVLIFVVKDQSWPPALFIGVALLHIMLLFALKKSVRVHANTFYVVTNLRAIEGRGSISSMGVSEEAWIVRSVSWSKVDPHNIVAARARSRLFCEGGHSVVFFKDGAEPAGFMGVNEPDAVANLISCVAAAFHPLKSTPTPQQRTRQPRDATVDPPSI